MEIENLCKINAIIDIKNQLKWYFYFKIYSDFPKFSGALLKVQKIFEPTKMLGALLRVLR